MHFGLTYLLVFLNSLWIAVVLYFHWHMETTVAETHTKAFLFNVHTIELASAEQGSKMVLHKSHSGWQLTQPFAHEANTLTIDLLLKKLLTEVKPQQENVTLTVDQKMRYGLELPSYTIRCADDQQTYTLQIGNDNENDQLIYANEWNRLVSVPPSLITLLKGSIKQWCTPFLIPLSDVTYLQLVTPQYTLVLNKQNQQWSSSSCNTPIDSLAIQKLCQSILELEFERFLTTREIQTYNPDFIEKSRLYTLSLSDGVTTLKLQLLPIQGTTDQYIVKLSDNTPLKWIQTPYIDELLHVQERYLERAFWHTDLSDIHSFSCSYQNRTLKVTSINGQQYEAALYDQQNHLVVTQEFTSTVIQPFFTELNTATVERYLTEQQSFSDSKCIALTLNLNDRTEQTITFWVTPTKQVYAQRAQDSYSCVLKGIDPNKLLTLFTLIDTNKSVWAWDAQEQIVSINLSSTLHPELQTVDWVDIPHSFFATLPADHWVEASSTQLFLNNLVIYTLIITTQNSQGILKTYELQFIDPGSKDEPLIGHYLNKNFVFNKDWQRFLSKIVQKSKQ